MSDLFSGRGPSSPAQPADLGDILERVLHTGVVIAGDIKIRLLDIELLTIQLRLLVVSVDKAREMGIDWWEHDRSLSSGRRTLARKDLP
ncbi:gas vesicle protein [Actinoplanes sp. NPDC049681]|uniref:gas vesicle protein n=1 Tax=Actinoplanes sp. NPDC049681 TaxID=3363905 RepID=UPI00378E73DE